MKIFGNTCPPGNHVELVKLCLDIARVDPGEYDSFEHLRYNWK